MKVVAISGYKPFELGIFKRDHEAVTYIKMALKNSLLQLADEGLEWVMISGQLGTELWAAEVVYELRESGEADLKLAVITAFLHQEENWSEDNQEWYHSIIDHADYVDAVSRKRYEKPWQFHLKNEFLLRKSDALLLFYDTEKEGNVKYFYEAAKKYSESHDYPMYFITFYDLQLLVEESLQDG